MSESHGNIQMEVEALLLLMANLASMITIDDIMITEGDEFVDWTGITDEDEGDRRKRTAILVHILCKFCEEHNIECPLEYKEPIELAKRFW